MGRAHQDDGVTAPTRLDSWVGDHLTRAGLHSRGARDVLLAVVVAVLTLLILVPILRADVSDLGAGQVEVLTWQRMGPVLAFATAQALVLGLRRARPVLCLVFVAGCQVAIIAVIPPELNVVMIALFLAAYTLGTMRPARWAIPVAMLVAVIEGAVAIALTIEAWTDALGLAALNHIGSALITYVGACLLGAYVRTHRRNLALLRQRAEGQAHAEQERIRSAIDAERSGIARELHDVAAHHLSAMVVQAAAVDRLIEKDPEGAKRANAWIRDQGKQTLADLRAVVGLLRESTEPHGPGQPSSSPSVPGLTGIDDLVRTARDLEVQVDLQRPDSLPTLAPLADVALYRITQEALTNARRHAPGAPICITLTEGSGQLCLEVVNGLGAASGGVTDEGDPAAVTGDENGAGQVGSGGAGLLGMRERAQLVGACLDAGPQEAGTWSVRVSVPVGSGEALAGSIDQEGGQR